MKRISALAAAVLSAALLLSGTACSKAKAVTGNELVADMKIGWNLGNTLDAWTAGKSNGLHSETCWGQPLTTAEMFKGLKKAGFNTVRIPITWHNHLIDGNYTIDPAWLTRCKEIVDWARDAGLYVIINVHHDTASSAGLQHGQGYYPAAQAKEESLAFLTRVWEQIAATFNNGYDEHLLFELLNEPRLVGHSREWWFDESDADCLAAQTLIREYEEACIAAIRASGGENARRYLLVPAYVAQPGAALSSTFRLPADSAEKRLIISVHMYDPWSFAGENPGERTFTQEARDGMRGTFEKLNEKFVQQGIPVIIGECGATNKDNLPEREAWFRYYFEQSKKNGITAILWDNGSVDIGPNGNVSEHYGFYDRTQQTFYFPTLLKAAMDGISAGSARH